MAGRIPETRIAIFGTAGNEFQVKSRTAEDKNIVGGSSATRKISFVGTCMKSDNRKMATSTDLAGSILSRVEALLFVYSLNRQERK